MIPELIGLYFDKEGNCTYSNIVKGRDVWTKEGFDIIYSEWRMTLDKNLKEKAILANLPSVVNVAKRFYRRKMHLKLSDLVQEGSLGLYDAWNLYDPAHSSKASFASFAFWYVRSRIEQAVHNTEKGIRIPKNVNRNISRLKSDSLKYFEIYGKEPTKEELAKFSLETLDNVEKIMGSVRSLSSLDDPLKGSSKRETFHHYLADPNPKDPMRSLKQEIYANMLNDFLHNSGLTKNEIKALQLRYGLVNGGGPMTLEMSSLFMDVGTERVRQLEAQAKKKIKKAQGNLKIEDF